MATIGRHRPFRGRRLRRGIAAVLIAALLPVFVGFLALSVDTAVIATSRAQLSTAGDASALAAALQLASDRRVGMPTDLSPETAAANAAAVSFGQANKVLGLGTTITTGANSDVTFGYMNPNNPAADLVTDSAYASLFNSVRVRASRDESRGGLVPGFFSKLMGFNGTKVTVQSTATAQVYEIKGFKSWNSLRGDLLPIVLDWSTYQAMISGSTTDQYTWNESTKTVTAGADGITESKLYPVASGSPGNWGTIKVGVSNNSTAILGDQIRNGISAAQLATFPGGKISLDTTLNPPSITFSGNPGISAGIKDDLISIIGRPVTIPIYDINGGNGNNAWYRVIAFAGCRILSVNFQGNPKYVIIQPALVTDPLAITGSSVSWSQGGKIVLHLTR